MKSVSYNVFLKNQKINKIKFMGNLIHGSPVFSFWLKTKTKKTPLTVHRILTLDMFFGIPVFEMFSEKAGVPKSLNHFSRKSAPLLPCPFFTTPYSFHHLFTSDTKHLISCIRLEAIWGHASCMTNIGNSASLT